MDKLIPLREASRKGLLPVTYGIATRWGRQGRYPGVIVRIKERWFWNHEEWQMYNKEPKRYEMQGWTDHRNSSRTRKAPKPRGNYTPRVANYHDNYVTSEKNRLYKAQKNIENRLQKEVERYLNETENCDFTGDFE